MKIQKSIFLQNVSKIINGNRFLQYFKLSKLCSSNINYKRLVIGNFFSDPHLFCYHKLNIDNLTILDDGMSTSLIKDYYKKGGRVGCGVAKKGFGRALKKGGK